MSETNKIAKSKSSANSRKVTILMDLSTYNLLIDLLGHAYDYADYLIPPYAHGYKVNITDIKEIIEDNVYF